MILYERKVDSMKLKESFRYMNFLEGLMEVGMDLLRTESFITKMKETHLRSKANPEAEDEVIEVSNSTTITDAYGIQPDPDSVDISELVELDFDTNRVICFMQEVLEEKDNLSKAISKSKSDASIDIDAATSSNKDRQDFVRRLRYMYDMKSYEKVSEGSGYKLNNEGNQVSYVYDIKKVTSINFDRNKVKKLIKSLSELCDKVSAEIDRVLITQEVEFEPKWSLTDTLEEICSDAD